MKLRVLPALVFLSLAILVKGIVAVGRVLRSTAPTADAGQRDAGRAADFVFSTNSRMAFSDTGSWLIQQPPCSTQSIHFGADPVRVGSKCDYYDCFALRCVLDGDAGHFELDDCHAVKP